jgi:hypothetical protein
VSEAPLQTGLAEAPEKGKLLASNEPLRKALKVRVEKSNAKPNVFQVFFVRAFGTVMVPLPL